VCDGETLKASLIPDEVFSHGMLGEGYGIKPKNGKIVSPVCGIVEVVTDTSHAYTVKSDDGAEILIHIGIDTVSLEGKGFTPRVTEGQRVKAGDEICTVDFEYIGTHGFPTVTAVILTNCEDFEIKMCEYGMATAGKTPVMYYRKKG
jgi:glucose-specific phosphotransferase system IIA component